MTLRLHYPSAKYSVTIHTSDIYLAGTNSDFVYTFLGTKGKTCEYYADNTGNDRKRGKEETWTFSDKTDIGQFKCILIRMEGKDGWLFDKVHSFWLYRILILILNLIQFAFTLI